METDSPNVIFKVRSGKSSQIPLLPELDAYIHLLVLLHLIDSERYELVGYLT